VRGGRIQASRALSRFLAFCFLLLLLWVCLSSFSLSFSYLGVGVLLEARIEDGVGDLWGRSVRVCVCEREERERREKKRNR